MIGSSIHPHPPSRRSLHLHRPFNIAQPLLKCDTVMISSSTALFTQDVVRDAVRDVHRLRT